MKYFVGCDHAALELKRAIVARLEERGHDVVDLGTHDTKSVDYPSFAHQVARRVMFGGARGILVCGTGIGMSIAANRHRGVRAALCHDVFSAKATREHNDANVLCLGARVVGRGLALAIVDAFDSTEFEGGRHQRRVDLIEG